MNLKHLIAIAGLSCSLVFAETGIEGGADGLHQQSAKTLGQWELSVGIGGEGVADAAGVIHTGNYYSNGKFVALNSVVPSISGNLHVAIGLLDYLDVGLVLPILYDDVTPEAGNAELYGLGLGDLQAWVKYRLPFIDKAQITSIALAGQIYLPTGDADAGLHPRHVWYVDSDGYVHAFTADAVALEGSAILTFDYNKVGVPLRWNSNVGFVGVIDGGTNALTWGTGLNLTADSAWDVFLEFSGETRIEDNANEINPLADPMRLTPGMRLHLPYGFDLAVGFDIGVNAFIAMEDQESYKVIKKSHGDIVTYKQSGSSDYGMSGLLTWKNVIYTPNDEDGDGVLDDKDLCRHTPKGVNVDPNGCPNDEDGDRIPDYLDQCKGTPKGYAVDSIGCPLKNATIPCQEDTTDSDQDGVYGDKDKCPNTPNGALVDNTGCTLDHDNDGVPDGIDSCPNTPNGFNVDSVGCTLDFDKDGVPDHLDQCPNTLPGIEIDSNGCPLRRTEDLDELKKGFQFKRNSAELTTSSYESLDNVVALLQKVPEANLEIQGYCDETGSELYNRELSKKRAKSVKNYLVSKGISSDRFRTIGYGFAKPIADNSTREGREKNRRVELVPYKLYK